MATELELKLMLHPTCLDQAVRYLDAFCSQEGRGVRQPTMQLMNAYYDTSEGLLMSSGIALRVRSVNQRHIQTLKTRGVSRVGMHARGEWEWDVPHDALDFTLITADMLPSNLKQVPWQSNVDIVYRTDFERHVWLINSPNAVIEAVCDRGDVVSPYGKDDICEIEFELKQGLEKDLYEMALLMAHTVPLQVCTVSKAQRGVRLKNPIIELPDILPESASNTEQSVYWYEVWLTYWEAMIHRKEDALFNEVKHALQSLKCLVSNDFSQEIESLLDVIDSTTEDDSPLYQQLPLQIQMGVCMLKIGHWLNSQQ
ncbi:CYTH domain-containing protein [Marinomonas sp. 2405UD68-3]|uniref:CYTH domain-containing protein n=1 Tax=Marinomonas sp. 2405UD68-3 TaxID=3391835 RepID=UPI0039C90D06